MGVLGFFTYFCGGGCLRGGFVVVSAVASSRLSHSRDSVLSFSVLICRGAVFICCLRSLKVYGGWCSRCGVSGSGILPCRSGVWGAMKLIPLSGGALCYALCLY